jgi:hypothetical protein
VEIAKAVSFIGLEGIPAYNNYINSYAQEPLKLFYINNIKNKIASTNNNCP